MGVVVWSVISWVHNLVFDFQVAPRVFSVLHLTVAAVSDVGRQLLHLIEARFTVFYVNVAFELFFSVFAVTKQMRARPAHCFEDFADVIE